jgi:hypothetical protein
MAASKRIKLDAFICECQDPNVVEQDQPDTAPHNTATVKTDRPSLPERSGNSEIKNDQTGCHGSLINP